MSSSKIKDKLLSQKLNITKEKKLINQLVSHFMEMLKKKEMNHILNTEFINEIKETLERDPIYFMHKIYPKLRIKYEEEFKHPKLKKKSYDFIEFEKTLLEDICFLEKEGEVVSLRFKGQMTQKIDDSAIKIIFKNANVFFTNKRMIVTSNGLHIDSIDPKVHGRFRGDYLHKYYISMIVNRSLYESKPCFGYEFPIFNLHKIKKTKTHVEFTFYQGIKKRICEIFPQDPSKLKEIKKELIEKNIDDIPPDNMKIHCTSCNGKIKLKHQFCKHCGKKANNHVAKKDSFLYN